MGSQLSRFVPHTAEWVRDNSRPWVSFGCLEQLSHGSWTRKWKDRSESGLFTIGQEQDVQKYLALHVRDLPPEANTTMIRFCVFMMLEQSDRSFIDDNLVGCIVRTIVRSHECSKMMTKIVRGKPEFISDVLDEIRHLMDTDKTAFRYECIYALTSRTMKILSRFTDTMSSLWFEVFCDNENDAVLIQNFS